MGELLLELLSEEIPARMQRRALDDLTGLIRDKLAAADIPAATLTGYVTPRRLVVIAEGIPERQPDRHEERRGPRVGAPEQALNGFLRSAVLASIDQCEVRGEFYFAVMKRPGRATAEVLPELILAAMAALPWPKSMRYPASELRWVRPLNSVVCLFGGEVVPLALGEVPVGRVTRGHRFLSPGEITVADAADYRAKLAKAHLVLDWRERRARIDTQLREKVTAEGLLLKDDQGLLDEVAGLVEYPVVLMGSIDADFVRPLPDGLPPEVLATAMRTHQKYFSCLKPDGAPAPRFLFVANNVTPDNGAAIVAGNERVLRARLSDAKFFWDQDRKVRLEDRVEALKQRIYHEKLGSVYDKVERVEWLTEIIANQLSETKPGASIAAQLPSGSGGGTAFSLIPVRAAHLAKADLSTGTVGEFPELQGIMGRYYALSDGEDQRVADAISEQYRPQGPSDACPRTSDGIVLAIADKLDSLVSFFAIGEEPSGSRDPFALRRAALGLIRTVIENDIRLTLKASVEAAAEIFYRSYKMPSTSASGDYEVVIKERLERVPNLYADVMTFIVDRLKVHLRDKGVRHDLIEAAFMQVGTAESDIIRLLARVDSLGEFLNTDDGMNLLIAYRRASNIVAIEERKDGPHDGPVSDELLNLPEERNLGNQLLVVVPFIRDRLRAEDFRAAMTALATLRQPVDEFFERVTVNVEDKELRENRLRLLARIRATMNQIADFSQIEG